MITSIVQFILWVIIVLKILNIIAYHFMINHKHLYGSEDDVEGASPIVDLAVIIIALSIKLLITWLQQ